MLFKVSIEVIKFLKETFAIAKHCKHPHSHDKKTIFTFVVSVLAAIVKLFYWGAVLTSVEYLIA